MFTQITVEMDLLATRLEKELDYISNTRASETNPNMFNEDSGRLIGITLAISEVEKTRQEIDKHIAEILKNTTDGNYMAKLELLTNENIILRDKVAILEDELDKFQNLRRGTIPIPASMGELSDSEMEQMIDEEIEKDDYDYSDFEENEE